MTEPVRRAAEIEAPSNLYIIHPLSAWLVPYLARAGISPNQVSLAGMGCGIAAGIAYHFYPHTLCVLLGFALMFAWHVLDGADGQLARLTQTFSELGKIIDGICDYVTFTAVYIGLAATCASQHGNLVWALVALSGLCHAIQSAAYELQRQYYNVYGLGRKSSALPDIATPPPPGLAALLHHIYARAQLLIGGDAAAFHARLAAQPDPSDARRARYCAVFAPVIRRWAILSANTRTLAIFLFTLAGAPLLYFFFETIVLSAALIALLADQRQRYRSFPLSAPQA
ncbi:CDP-alcohol phosphatidyltransferase family protein [Acidocella sp.]|uniref:CDP-alcohol phosphatidyltransferase family protein n=1 Tax=Acidocella sp. TaxID=50710 RepID=UPI00260FA9AD|nr:CDP-alcohol phosphatidyltransferase family protein [Acidocella sp.]